MTIAKHESIKVQANIRRNAEEQIEYLKDLASWEATMSKKEIDLTREIVNDKSKLAVACNNKTYNDSTKPQSVHRATDLSKLSEYDSTNTDDALLPHVKGKQGTSFVLRPSVAPVTSSIPTVTQGENDEGESTKKVEVRQSKEFHEKEERQRGNSFYANGHYLKAIECYNRCLGIDPKSVSAFSNRAMAYLKIGDWTNAESDATAALSVDPNHVKSFQRRSAARLSLGKLRAALQDILLAEHAAKTLSIDPPKELRDEKRKVEEALRDAVLKAPRRKIHLTAINATK